MNFIWITLLVVPIIAGQLLGGWNNIALDDEEIQKFLPKIEKLYNQQVNDANQHKAIRFVDAKSQIVNGVNYKFKIEMGRTNCRLGKVCNDPSVSNKHQIDASVYKQPWTNTESISFKPSN
uniref:Cystatin domain-containing protein n=1 Tax=Bursaphelenchus xylophilus TaxID=6326 RepID=A0A1I7RZ06_BURXY